jgi:IS605 OrfB family transposase
MSLLNIFNKFRKFDYDNAWIPCSSSTWRKRIIKMNKKYILKTIKIPLKVPNERKCDLLQTMDIVKDIYNIHVNWAFENKSISKQKAHESLYYIIKDKYPQLPVQYIQSTRDNALENVKRDKFKHKPIKKSYSIRLDACTITLNKNNSLTFSCINKRIKTEVSIPEYFTEIRNNWKFASAIITYNKRSKKFSINLIFKTDKPNLINFENKDVVGIDLGLHNIITLSDGKKINSNIIKKNKRKFQYLRLKLQSKGTSSAKRHLKKLSGKEARFSSNYNHILSKQLVNSDYKVFVFEDLKTIRKYKYHSRKLNRMISNWSFGQLINYTEYKAEAIGKHVYKVNPAYTSQTCSICGNVLSNYRNHSHFKCSVCNHIEHADINAAKNIRNVFLSTLKKSDNQADINQPIVFGCYNNLETNYVACLHSS